MYAVMDFIPNFCPSCGRELAASHKKDALSMQDWHAHCAMICKCGLTYQLADTSSILSAAIESGGDMS